MSDYKEIKREHKEQRKEEKRQRKLDRKLNKYENKISKTDADLKRKKSKEATKREVHYDSRDESSGIPLDAPEGYSSFFKTTDPSFTFDSSEEFGSQIVRPEGYVSDDE